MPCEKRKPPRPTPPSPAERAHLERFYAQRLDHENVSLAARVMLRRLEEVFEHFAPGSILVPPPPNTPDELLLVIATRGTFYATRPTCHQHRHLGVRTELLVGFTLGCDGLWRMSTATPRTGMKHPPHPTLRRSRFFGFPV